MVTHTQDENKICQSTQQSLEILNEPRASNLVVIHGRKPMISEYLSPPFSQFIYFFPCSYCSRPNHFVRSRKARFGEITCLISH